MKLRANVRPQWQWAKLLQISGISAELQQINATGFDN